MATVGRRQHLGQLRLPFPRCRNGAAYPDVFRAQSRHGLWADWNSARGVAFSETASALWQNAGSPLCRTVSPPRI